MRPLRVTARAARDLKEAVGFIAQGNPMAAETLAARLDETMALLARFPEAGPALPGRSFRILQVAGTPYRLVYSLSGAEVTTLRVWHGARAWPPAS